MIFFSIYPAFDSLMEPHRLIACVNCIVSVYKTMLGQPDWYPEGKLHVIPIMNMCLPGIDANDIRKCLVRYYT